MKRLSLAVAIILVVGLWFVIKNDTSRSREADAPVPTVASKVDGNVTLVPPANAERLVDVEQVHDARTPVPGFESTQPGELHGLIRFPAESAIDPTLAVVAFFGEAVVLPPVLDDFEAIWWPAVAELSKLEPVRVSVAADNFFSIPVPAGARSATLFIDGQRLYLRRGQSVRFPLSAPVILEPEVGACLRIHCRVATDLTAELGGLAGTELGLRLYDPTVGFDWNRMHRRTAVTDSRGVGEFRGLPPRFGTFVYGEPEGFAVSRDFGFVVEPGRINDHDLFFRFGMDYAGQVVNAEGLPLEGVAVEAAPAMRAAGHGPGTRKSTTTDANGYFEIADVRVGPTIITAALEGYQLAETEMLSGQDGGEKRDLEFVLTRGRSISGVALREDGSPAANVKVELARVDDNERVVSVALGSTTMRARSVAGWDTVVADENGRFEFSGLEEALHDIYVSSELPLERLRLDGVAAGSTELELRLQSPATLLGNVKSTDNSSVPAFSLVVFPKSRAEERIEQEFASADGSFEFEGLYPGRWWIGIEAPGWRNEEPVREFVFPLEEPLVFTLTPAARVAGVVLDSTGEPVAGCDVTLKSMAEKYEAPLSKRTNTAGEFAFADVLPGLFKLRARHDDYAPSEAVALELLAGLSLEGQELRVLSGGRIVAEIYNADGTPDVDRKVQAFSRGAGDSGTALSDASGSFVMEHLAPGSYVLIAQPSMAELDAMRRGENGADRRDMPSITRDTEIEVVEGETAHAVMGGALKDPVRVHGRVTALGSPVTKGVLSFDQAGSVPTTTKLDSEGRYEIEFEERGQFTVVYQEQLFRSPPIEFPVTIPEGDNATLNFELPMGVIEGIIVDAAGDPVKAAVLATRETGLAQLEGLAGRTGDLADDEGRFEITNLFPGTYTLRMGGKPYRRPAKTAAVVVSNVVVKADERTSGLVLHVPAMGALAGEVVDEFGKPAAEVALFLWNAAGEVLQPRTSVETDLTGAFEYGGIPVGDVRLGARSKQGSSKLTDPVSIREGETTEINVVLASGVTVRVRTENAAGEPVRVRLHLFDANGLDHTGLDSSASVYSGQASGNTAVDQRVGPLPPGSYRLEATSLTGETLVRELTLEPNETGEQELLLRFDD